MLTRKDIVKAGTAVAFAFSIFAGAANADTVDAVNFGSYSQQGSHVGYNFNFGTGYSDLEFRSFFAFDLSSIAPGSVGAAVLRLWNSTPAEAPPGYLGYNSADATETINLYSVSSASALALSDHAYSNGAGDPNGVSIFNDLGDGVLLGTATVSKDASGPGSFVDISLNADGVAAINANAGGHIAFGGSLGSLAAMPGFTEFLFSGWANNDLNLEYPYFDATHAQLTTSPVPLPAAVWLLGSGLAGLFGLRRRATATA